MPLSLAGGQRSRCCERRSALLSPSHVYGLGYAWKPRRSSMKPALAFFCIFACSVFGFAQAPSAAAAPAAPVKDPVATSLRMLLTRSQNNTVGAVEAMAADKFNYKPTPDQMTFGHL